MSNAYITEHTVQPVAHPGMHVENPYCIRYSVSGSMLARQGAMVAYRGDLTINTKGQGLRSLVKRAVTGEGVALMEVAGTGDIWLADTAKNVFIVDGEGLTVSGKNILCFDPTLHYEISMIKSAGMVAGGLFNSTFTGQGSLAVTSHGQPIVIPVTHDAPVLVDTDAVIGWTSSLQASIFRSESMKSFLKGSSGEMFQLKLSGDGIVIVAPSEGFPTTTK